MRRQGRSPCRRYRNTSYPWIGARSTSAFWPIRHIYAMPVGSLVATAHQVLFDGQPDAVPWVTGVAWSTALLTGGLAYLRRPEDR